ncbi:MAG: hypothetical protein ACK5PP_01680 [Acidimicrobiales bacterium]
MPVPSPQSVADRATGTAQLRTRVRPVSLACHHLLPVPEPIADLFPAGGLQQGSSVGFRGPGGHALALALAASALGTTGWMAAVGAEDVGWVAAAELGVPLERLLVVSSASASHHPTVLAALVETMDVILLGPGPPVGHRNARRITARIRERGTVMFHLDGGRGWPDPLDLVCTTADPRWEGVGVGHGHLRHRWLSVGLEGRRAPGRVRPVTVGLPGPGGGLTPADPAHQHQQADRAPVPPGSADRSRPRPAGDRLARTG